MAEKDNIKHYVVIYRDPAEDKITSLKAKTIGDSSLGLSFIRISDFVFDTNSLVVKPSEEALEKRYQNIKCIHLSIYTIVSIEEVGADHEGLSFIGDRSNLVVLHNLSGSSPDNNNKS